MPLTPENIRDILLEAREDPIVLQKYFWPNVYFYDKQRAVAMSVKENDETYVPAGNKLGKDYVAGFIILWFFLTRSPCRVITTSAGDDHLRVLWGEIGRYIQTCSVNLDWRGGGPLVINHQDIRRWDHTKKAKCPISYIKGLVASLDNIAKMQGHHATVSSIESVGDRIPRTLFASDESSSVRDEYYKMAVTWAQRLLIFGNPWPCENFFRKGVKAGDLLSNDGKRYYRKIIKIKAEDSPNVRYQLGRIRAGLGASDELLIPGVKDYDEYAKNRATWDHIQQCVSLDAEFYEGVETKLFPAEWLNYGETLASSLSGRSRQAKAVGIDPGEGVADSAFAAVDEYGIIELMSKKTPDTSDILGMTIAFAQKHGVPPHKVFMDRGGGGKQHSDKLEKMGWKIHTVGFGETLVPNPRRGLAQIADRIDDREERYAYKNRRAEMYGMLRELFNTSNDRNGIKGYGIPARYSELRRQLAALPLWWDEEGRMYLPPKQRKSGESLETTARNTITINSLLGCSPDQADAVVLAVYGMLAKSRRPLAGVS